MFPFMNLVFIVLSSLAADKAKNQTNKEPKPSPFFLRYSCSVTKISSLEIGKPSTEPKEVVIEIKNGDQDYIIVKDENSQIALRAPSAYNEKNTKEKNTKSFYFIELEYQNLKQPRNIATSASLGSTISMFSPEADYSVHCNLR